MGFLGCVQYSVPFATVYRLMAVVSANGFTDLPRHCLPIAGGLVGAAVALNLVRHLTHVSLARIPVRVVFSLVRIRS